MELPGPAIITGAAGGIGRAIAKRFADFNCTQAVLVDTNAQGLDDTRKIINDEHPKVTLILLACDLTEDGVVKRILETTVENFGRVSYLINCAGSPGGFFTAADTDIDIFDRVQQLNVRATWLLQQAAIQQMLQQELVDGERGSIVNIGSVVSHVAMPRLSAYTTSKHAVLGLTRADAVDNALNHIRINCVTPGLIDTNLGAHIPKEIRDRELTPGVMKTPMRRMGEANEVANSVVFLSSRMASYITGASLAVDGGFTAA